MAGLLAGHGCCRARRQTGLQDATALDAVRADLDLAPTSCVGVDDRVNNLQVRLEQTRRDSGDVLADTALFLGLTAPQDAVTAHAAFATNFTTSRHYIDSVPFESAEQ